MDQILKGIVASEHPENVKKSLIQQLVGKSANEIPEEQCNALFDMSCQWMAKGNVGTFLSDIGKLLLTSWARHHKDIFQKFFTESYLVNLLENTDKLTVGSINYIRVSFDLLQHTPHIFALYTVVRHRVHACMIEHPTIEFGGAVCRMLIDYNHCWPVGDHLLQMNIALIQSLSKTQLPKSSKLELKACIQDGGIIGALLNQIWIKNQNLLFPVLTEVFSVISASGPNPSVAVASVVSFFSPEIITTATRLVATNPSVSDESLALALSRMISWLSWPGGKRVDQWITSFLRSLAMSGKHAILIQVTLDKLPQVFSRLLFPVVRESTMVVLSHMLLSFQHSPQAFHLIVEHVPDLVKSLKREDSVSSKACLQTLAELMHCLMHQHSGFPELYGPVLDCLQDHPKPSDAMIKKWLTQSAWSAQYTQLSAPRITPKSDTGKTGLVNLGNTCYMNSILQALFMLDEFRSTVMLKQTARDFHKVLYQLQEVFAFLNLSQRAAISPSKFLRAARPPWFSSGSQQDCSEFLKYLLDRLEEEDRIPSTDGPQADHGMNFQSTSSCTNASSNIVEDSFAGRLIVCHSCRRCRHVSCREEAFTDLPLAFPRHRALACRSSPDSPSHTPNTPVENDEAPATERSLKGGDIGQRPPAAGISSSPQEEAGANEEGASNTGAAATAFPFPKGPIKQSKASSMGIGADAPSISLEELLGYFFEPETLEGSNQYHCERCQGLQDAERSVVISSAPKFLVLTLKRFSYNVRTHERSKILQSVSYPARLQLSNVCVRDSGKGSSLDPDSSGLGSSRAGSKQSPGHSSDEGSVDSVEERLSLEAPPSKCTKQDPGSDPGSSRVDDPYRELREAVTIENFPSETLYALTSVIVHSGTSSESGHYYCYARPSGRVVLPEKGKGTDTKEDTTARSPTSSSPPRDASRDAAPWYLFNDSRVSYASFESFSDITKRFPKDTPYVLIYKNISRPVSVRKAAGQDEEAEDKIRQDLMDAVTRDNILYLQECQRQTQILTRRNMSSNPPRRDDDDSDNGPPGGCGGEGGFNAPFNRFVF